MPKKYIKIAVTALILIVIVAVWEVVFLKPEAFRGPTLALGLLLGLVIGPALMISTLVVGTGRVAKTLVSKDVSNKEKKGMLKRILIVIIIGVVGAGAYTLLNAIGTALIDI